jgi:hypothetical protein
MNILELDSYNLADAVKFNDRLNPILWGSGEQLKSEVRKKLLAIADEFREFLGVNDLQLKDITISGSNAAYTYTPHSDIDLHLVVDLPEADRNEVYRELFDAKKYVFNDMHDIKIGGYDVELYVQDANKPHHSQGIYSVVNNEWVDVPKRRRTEIDDVSTQSKYEDLTQRIDTAIASNSYKQMSGLTEKIRDMRQAGLDEHGEFGPENLAFKMLRSQGKIKELYDARNAAKDQELSLAERDRKKPVFRYGFGRPHIEEDAGETWDGVNPTTCMFLNEEDPEPTDEEILKDFIDFCAKELKLEHMPAIKLRRDPQWSVVHKTFGRYINDRHLLEVAWGQRHIMDILRTVAHELTHTHQHEREEVPVTAGETGSEYENEANARAGVLMRDYARLHPEFFAAGQAEELPIDEGIKSNTVAAAIVAALAGNPIPVSAQVGNFISLIQNVATVSNTAQKITRAGINAEVQQEIQNYVRAVGRDPEGQNLSHLYQLQRELGRQAELPATAPLPGYMQQNNPPANESASGYIPTRKQAKDPRFSMALTKDIRPGALGLNANKLKLNTNRQGQPQIANTNGVVQRMKEQLAAFKQGIILESEELDEVKMSPTALKKFADSPAAEGIQVGFEAELIFPDVNTGEEEGDMEADYDADERCRSIQQVIEFFEYDEYGYGISGREADKLQERLEEAYMEWYDEQMMRDFGEEADDLIKKVMIDEKDWVQEDEVRKQLDMMDITGADQEAVLAAGSRAPTFKTTAEQQAYTEENPEYEKYLEALGEAEGLLDELVQDSVRAQDKYWDQAIDDFRDYYQLDDDSGFFEDVDLRYMSDVANRFDIYWPYMTFPEGEGSLDIDSVADSLKDVVQMPVTASGGYHQATRKPGVWIVEPDGSLSADNSEDGGLEIISPPMPIAQAMEKLQAVIDWAQKRGCYTNSSTGLHMGVSLPGQQSFAEAEGDAETAPVAEKPIDFMKLALFLGDQYVLKEFGREANSYCRSSLEKLKAKNWSPQQIATAMEKMRGNLINLAYKDLSDRSPGRDSINMKDNYVEFRSAGGDYLSKESDQGIDFLFNTMLRYVRALDIAGDPAAERQEYAKKLYKLISPEGDNTLDLFSKFATGEIDKEKLKTEWARKTLEKDEPSAVNKGNWVVVDNNTGKTVQGQEYSGYTEDEVREKAQAKLGEYLTDVAFNQKYSIHPKETGRWEIYRDDHGKDETLEIIDADRKGEAVDKAYDTYSGVIPFKVRAYYGDEAAKPEPTRRAKLAKQIIQKPAQDKDYNYEIVNLGDVNLGVVDKFYATNKQDADATFDKWLKMKGLPNDTSDYGYRPRKQEKEVDVVQNFSTNSNPTAPIANQARAQNGVPIWDLVDRSTDNVINSTADHTAREAWGQFTRYLTDIGAEDPATFGQRFIIRAQISPQDATEQEGTWQIFDATLRQPIETVQGAWSFADRISREYETSNGPYGGHEISVRRAQ